MATVTRVDFKGPFFERDVRKSMRTNIRDMMGALAQEAESDVKGQVGGRHGSMPRSTGATYASIKGRTTSLGGKQWQVTAVVSANTGGMDRATAIRIKAAASTIERRWHPFRRTSFSIRRARAVISANLTKNIE